MGFSLQELNRDFAAEHVFSVRLPVLCPVNMKLETKSTMTAATTFRLFQMS
jgi:hypothetical protein